MKITNQKSGYKFLDHTADVWVHAWGITLENAFEQSALALMDTMIASDNITPLDEKIIEIEGHDKGSLLIAFLSEFLYLFDIDQWIFSKILVKEIKKLSPNRYKLTALSHGETYNPKKHEPDTEVKAITYSYLEIKEGAQKTEIKIVFDI